MFEYVGALHIHSIFSDGTGRVDEIGNYADEVNLDFIVLTDHNTLRALDEGFERYYGKTLLLVGCELNDKKNQNHYLALGIKKTISTRVAVKEYVEAVKDQGGVGFIAHPHERRSKFENHPPYPWTEWNIDNFDGIEIWNHMSMWIETMTEENKYNHIMHPYKSLEGPDSETLKVWDELNIKRKIVGIGGIDAHAHRINFLGVWDFEIFPYKVLFKSIRTHILTEQQLSRENNSDKIAGDKSTIQQALSQGRSFISNFNVGDASGFRFFAETGKKIFQMGDQIDSQRNVVLKALIPGENATVRLICNGSLVDESTSNNPEYIISKSGVYRLEVYHQKRPWIFSNHIRIGV